MRYWRANVAGKGHLVPDAYHATLAIASGCDWITTDKGLLRFTGLRAHHPFRKALEAAAKALARIRTCTQSGTPMGSERFKAQIEQTLRRKVGSEKRDIVLKVRERRGSGLSKDGLARSSVWCFSLSCCS